MNFLYYIIAGIVLIIIPVLIYQVKQQRKDAKTVYEYNKKMDNIRKSRIFEKEVKKRKNIEPTNNFYTTYNEREDCPNPKRTSRKNEHQ